MADFMARVELLKANWEDYSDLHEDMEALGLKRTVVFSNGSICKLPIGTYFGTSSIAIEDLREKIKNIATPLSAPGGPWIFLSQSETWSACLPVA